MMLICIKQQLSNIWSSVHEKLNDTEVKLKKGVTKFFTKMCDLVIIKAVNS